MGIILDSNSNPMCSDDPKMVLSSGVHVGQRRKSVQQDRDNEWTSRAMEFEKAWEHRNPRKAYALLKQEHFETLLNRLAPSAPELEHVHRPTYAINEEPPTKSDFLFCIQKMKDGKSSGDDGVSAEMLKYLPPSGISETTKIIRSIWIDERIPDSWRHAIIIPLHKKLSVTDPWNYRGISAACYVQAPSGCPLTDLEYADDVVIFAESSTKLQHVVNLVSKLAAAYGLRLRPDKCKQMWISSRPRKGIRVDGQPIELVDEFCYLGCTLKNNGSYERDVQQRCAKATSAFNSLTKCLWSTLITYEVKLRVHLSAIRPIMMYGSET
ncbi:hypothetical protein RB195_012140 [Necator americanus]|uniref:Reverse transcriptase domain-containing protein n=1 Tax=Necator americanus TaxID=51031 RepID=A0ABR1D6M2_NECAM